MAEIECTEWHRESHFPEARRTAVFLKAFEYTNWHRKSLLLRARKMAVLSLIRRVAIVSLIVI